ncbi:Uncharacterised protein [Yersinia kristensenii]|nr:Uncharacterised protein [Yersinia kristensenii]
MLFKSVPDQFVSLAVYLKHQILSKMATFLIGLLTLTGLFCHIDLSDFTFHPAIL